MHKMRRKSMMKKKYIKPKIEIENLQPEAMLAVSNEGMGSNETPGGDEDFNAPGRRGTWGNLWDKSYKKGRW
jgi:hypothetical protein